MKIQRYFELETKPNLNLTEEEYSNGWHFCSSEWDGLLIHTSFPEFEVCTCYEQKIWENKFITTYNKDKLEN